MKKAIILLIVLSHQSYSQEKQLIEAPKVNRNVELLSIVFRLAGNQEYNATLFKKYTDRIDAHFNAFKGHKLIKFANELHQTKGISYDAVASMAIILDDNLEPMIDFSTSLPEKRWAEEDAYRFIRLLKKFYTDAGCEAFFKENEELYDEAASRFAPVFQNLDFNWFQSFYGKSAGENFNIILSPGVGGHNYGPSYTLPGAKKEVFAIVGIWKTDDSGMPLYNENEYLPTIIHEFNHSFVNPLLEKNKALFEESGKEIYKAVEYEMSQQAYGNWETMVNEALVRAAVIEYFADHGAGDSEIGAMLNNETNRGFLWIKGVVAELQKYNTQRDTYPTLESYMPVLSEAYKTFAEKISQYDSQRPVVLSINEFANFDVGVSSQLKTITVNFDKPLAGKGYSVFYGAKGKSYFPKIDNISYINDNKSVVMEVQLEPNKEYQFVLTGKNFKTAQGVGLKSYEVNFRTR